MSVLCVPVELHVCLCESKIIMIIISDDCDTKITLHYEFLEESILFGFQMNGEVFHILNYCILNGKYYIHKQKLFHENALDFYDYLWEL